MRADNGCQQIDAYLWNGSHSSKQVPPSVYVLMQLCIIRIIINANIIIKWKWKHDVYKTCTEHSFSKAMKRENYTFKNECCYTVWICLVCQKKEFSSHFFLNKWIILEYIMREWAKNGFIMQIEFVTIAFIYIYIRRGSRFITQHSPFMKFVYFFRQR